MRFHTGLLCLVLFSFPCHALLPPFYQSAKEITAILNNAEIADKITSGRVIQSIARTDHGYRITANDCILNVTIKYLSPKAGMVGPAEFEVQSDRLVCTKE